MIFNDRLKDRNQSMISLDMKIISAKLKRLPFFLRDTYQFEFYCSLYSHFLFSLTSCFSHHGAQTTKEATTRPIFSPGNDLSSF